VPVVVPDVVPDVVVPVVEPEVVPLVVPVVVPVVVPEVDIPDVVPDVEPEVEPLVLPEVEPLVVPAFSEAVQALKRVSDEHMMAPVSPKSHLRFIRVGKNGKEGFSLASGCKGIRAFSARFTRISLRVNTHLLRCRFRISR
jgi:hypothetical protein